MKLLLVDGTNVAYRWIKDPSIMLDKFPSTIISLARSFKCESVLVSFDNKKSTYRTDLFPDYKGNRTKDLTEEEQKFRKIFYDTVSQVPDILTAHDIPSVALESVETDDVIAYICKHYHHMLEEITIISSDEDLYQLFIYPNVKTYALTLQKEMNPTLFRETYNVDPSRWVNIKAMMGDVSDNIDGIYLVGIKRAIQYLDTYGPTFKDILRRLPKEKKKKLGKIDKTVLESEDIVERNMKLMDLITYVDDIISDTYVEIIQYFLESEGIIDE